ncbi:MAG: M6 family metalloprotease domain-containing protein [candidate division WOR-3 bacterium]
MIGKSNCFFLLFLVYLITFVIGSNSTYACIGHNGQIPPIRSYPAEVNKLPVNQSRFGENTLVILVDFPDCAGSMPQDSWNKILLTTNTPGKSMRDYYLEVSSNYVILTGAQENSIPNNNGVVGWYRMPFNHPYNRVPASQRDTWEKVRGDSLPGCPPGCRSWALSQQLAYLAVQKADSNVDYCTLPWIQPSPPSGPAYTYAHIIIIVAGYEASYYGRPSNPTPNTWRHHWFIPGMGYYTNDFSSNPNPPWFCYVAGQNYGMGYCLLGERASPGGGIIGQGLVSHEVGHDLGFPDLYDVDATDVSGGDGLGQWCLMAGGDWLGSPWATKPGHLSAWCKVDQGWVYVNTVQNSILTNVQIPAIESVPIVYKLIPYNQPNCHQYFLVENRQLKKFDGALPGSGLIIYHCDDSMINLHRSRYDNTVNSRVGYTDAMHYGVDVECQDGFPANGINRDDLDTVVPFNRGDANDPWDGSPDFDTNSTPNSSIYYGSKSIVKSYVAVKNISVNSGIVTADLWTMPPSAEFSVTPTTIDFGEVNIGSSKTDSVTVTNNGSVTLIISSVSSDNGEFDVDPSSANLEPDSSKKFYISFSPTTTGNKSGNIEFVHNGASSPDTVAVSGSGVTSGIPGWTQKEAVNTNLTPAVDKVIKDGGALVGVGDDDLYALIGTKTNVFRKYTIGSKSGWVTVDSLPFGPKYPRTTPLTTNKKFVGKGAALCYDGVNTIYATRGNGTREFWTYNLTTFDWTLEESIPVPKGIKYGTAMAFNDGKVYLLAGGQKKTDVNNFYVYDTATKHWSTSASLPLGSYNKVWKDGSCLAVCGNQIYALKGGDKDNLFYAFDGSAWTPKETLPKPDIVFGSAKTKVLVKAGGGMASDGNVIYAIKGGATDCFWRYTPSSGLWQRLESIPVIDKKHAPKTGAAMAFASSRIWLLVGNKQPDFWCYTPGIDLKLKNQNLISTYDIIASNTRATANLTFMLRAIPNPFNKLTTINYTVPIAENVTIKLYNASGRLIRTLVNRHLSAGFYKTTLTNIASGVYFLRYQSETNKSELKLIVR